MTSRYSGSQLSPPVADDSKGLLAHPRLVFAITMVGIIGMHIGQLRGTGLSLDPDSLVRMVSVRDLLAGQAWFDTVQARVLPPEGLTLHWSRLLDAVLAGLVLVFSVFLPRESAEFVAMAVWPATLLAVFVLILGAMMRGRFGLKAASLTMLVAGWYQVPRGFYFRPGDVDHHNLQLVLMALCGWGVLARSNKLRAGIGAGAAMALSLAIGLEGAGFFAATIAYLAIRFIIVGQWEAERIGGFGLGLALLSPVLFIAQTPPAEWALIHCDVLAPPALAVTTALGAASLLLVRLTRGGTTRQRAFATMVLTAFVAIVLLPVLSSCRGGPYNMVPPEVRDLVIANVLENRPIPYFLSERIVLASLMVLPLFAAIVMLAPTLGSGPEQDARIFLVVIVALGLAAGFLQERLMLWGWAMLPAALGLGLADFVRTSRIDLAWALRLLIVLIAIFPYAIGFGVQLLRQGGPKPAPPAEGDAANTMRCGTPKALEPLNQLPSAIIFNPSEIAPALLYYTHHSVTGASYHRNPKALELGIVPFLADDANVLKQAVEEANADFIVLCRGELYGPNETIGTRLAKGERPDWLQEIKLPGSDRLIVLKVLKPQA